MDNDLCVGLHPYQAQTSRFYLYPCEYGIHNFAKCIHKFATSVSPVHVAGME
jgi:hypothetical protein